MIDEKLHENIQLDSTKWNDLMKKVLKKITGPAMNERTFIEKNYRELKQKREITNNFRERNCGKHIVSMK